MKVRLLRHATLVAEVAGKRLLVDPMLSKMEAMDPAAQEKIGKNTLLFCQPADAEKIRGEGTGEIGKKMGIVSGYVLTNKKQRLYIAGDTIWCSDVQDALAKHKPTHIHLISGLPLRR